MTEIAAPFARALLLEGNPQLAKARKEFGKRLALQVCVGGGGGGGGACLCGGALSVRARPLAPLAPLCSPPWRLALTPLSPSF